MTSKISFSKMARDEMKKLTWLTAVQFLVFGLLIPFRVLLVMASKTADEYMRWSDTTAREIFCKQVGFGHPENTVFILAAGILCALCAFGYVHSQVKLDFFHSLPVKRERLFAVKYLGSALTFAAAYLGCQVLAVLIGCFYGAVSPGTVFEVAVASVQGILYFLCSYSGTLVAVMLTGKMLTTVLAVGVFGLYLPMIYLLWMMFGEIFYRTALDSGIWENNADILRYTSPWTFCMFQKNYNVSKIGLTGAWPEVEGLCQVVAVTVIMTLISVLLYRARKTERAGSALAFRRVESIVKLLLTVPTSLVAAVVAYEMFDSPVWEVFFILLFGALSCMIMEFIYRGDIRQAATHRMHIVCTVVAAAVIFFAFRYDVTGYNTYIPEKEELAAMSIVGFDGYEYYYWEDGKSLNNGYVNASSTKVLDYVETENFDLIYQVAQNGVEEAATGAYQEDYVNVAIKYRTVDGKETYRRYDVDKDVYLKTMEELQKDPDFRKKYYPIENWDAEYISGMNSVTCYVPEGSPLSGALGLEDEESGEDRDEEQNESSYDDVLEYAEEYWQSGKTIEIPLSRVAELVEAYKEDLGTVTYGDIWESTTAIEFGSYNKSWKRYGGHLSESYPLNENFTHTVELLKEIAAEDGKIGFYETTILE